MDGRKLRLLFVTFLVSCFYCSEGKATLIELSAMVAYNTTDFADGYKSMQRRYTGSMDFKFTPVSSFEFEYTDSVTKISYPTNLGNLIPHYTNYAVTYKDKIYSFNWVQSLVPARWLLQPYFVVGGGRMIRDSREEIPEIGISHSTNQNVVTGVGAVGLRIFLLKNMALKAEIKTYVPKFHYAAWKENQMMSVGFSWSF